MSSVKVVRISTDLSVPATGSELEELLNDGYQILESHKTETVIVYVMMKQKVGQPEKIINTIK